MSDREKIQNLIRAMMSYDAIGGSDRRADALQAAREAVPHLSALLTENAKLRERIKERKAEVRAEKKTLNFDNAAETLAHWSGYIDALDWLAAILKEGE